MTNDPSGAVERLQVRRARGALLPIWWLANVLVWLGGASWRGIGDRHERSQYLQSGFFVLLNGIIATGLAALAAVGMGAAPDFLTAVRYTFVWGVFVALFDRAVSAKVVDPAHPRLRSAGGYILRGVAAVLIGFVVAEAGAMAIFHQDIDRTMNDTINAQVNNSLQGVVGTPDAPSQLAQELSNAQNQKAALDKAVTDAQLAYNTAEEVAACEFDPRGCPASMIQSNMISGIPGGGSKVAVRNQEKAAAAATLQQAKLAQQQKEPAVVAQIDKLQGQIDDAQQHARQVAESANGIPAKWRAMLDYTSSTPATKLMHGIIIGFCVLLDLIPLLLKLWRGRTAYEAAVLASRRRNEGEVAAAEQEHQADMLAEHGRGQVRRELDLDLERMAAEGTRRIETERERLRVERALRDLQEEDQAEQDRDLGADPDEDDVVVALGQQAPPPPVSQPLPALSQPALPPNWDPEDRELLHHVFDGRYQAVEPLAGADVGAFGRILRGVDQQTGREVVIKAVREPVAGRRLGRKSVLHRMWQQEVGAARRLENSPHIGEIPASGLELGYLWTVSPLYKPGSLVHWIEETVAKDPNGYPLRVAFDHMTQLVDALVYAHGRNVTHGDIKPTNTVLHGPTLILVDWGFARVASQLSSLLEADEPGLVGGTPHFTAPEALLGKDFDPVLADIFAVGATWYFILTGRPPYQGPGTDPDPRETARRIRAGQVPFVRLETLVPGLPADVAAIVHTLISPEPRDRSLDRTGVGHAAALLAAIHEAFKAATLSDAVDLPVGRHQVRHVTPVRLPSTRLESPLLSRSMVMSRPEPVHHNGTRHDAFSDGDTVRLALAVEATVVLPVEPMPTTVEEALGFTPPESIMFDGELPMTEPEDEPD